MRRSQRLIAATVLISLCTLLAGCSGGFDNFDPTDLFDWLNTKKPLPGTRQPVFPNGVPGVEEGVPKDLYKSAVEQRERQDEAAEAAAVAAAGAPTSQPPAAADSGAGAGGKQTARNAPAETARGPVHIAPEPKHKKPPKHKKRKLARKRVTTPRPAQSTTQYSQQPAQAAPVPASEPAQSAQQSPPPFPAPLPSGSFSR